MEMWEQVAFYRTLCVQTSLRPDTIMVSETTRQLILLELTVPWEERMEEAQKRKRAKYQSHQ